MQKLVRLYLLLILSSCGLVKPDFNYSSYSKSKISAEAVVDPTPIISGEDACSDGTLHGEEVFEEFYLSGVADSQAACEAPSNKVTLSRTCNNGAYFEWPANAISACYERNDKSCSDTVGHNQVEKSTVYPETVPFGTTCVSAAETRSRSCFNGQFSEWDSQLIVTNIDNCTVQSPLFKADELTLVEPKLGNQELLSEISTAEINSIDELSSFNITGLGSTYESFNHYRNEIEQFRMCDENNTCLGSNVKAYGKYRHKKHLANYPAVLITKQHILISAESIVDSSEGLGFCFQDKKSNPVLNQKVAFKNTAGETITRTIEKHTLSRCDQWTDNTFKFIVAKLNAPITESDKVEPFLIFKSGANYLSFDMSNPLRINLSTNANSGVSAPLIVTRASSDFSRTNHLRALDFYLENINFGSYLGANPKTLLIGYKKDDQNSSSGDHFLKGYPMFVPFQGKLILTSLYTSVVSSSSVIKNSGPFLPEASFQAKLEDLIQSLN